MGCDLLPSKIGVGETAEDFRQFVRDHSTEDTGKLRLKFAAKTGSVPFDLGFAIDQIECRQRTRTKLPRFLSCESALFPAVVSAEQASDEGIALFHASLLRGDESVADLTAGLGIDAMTMARSCREMTAIELDPLRAEVLRYNTEVLGINNIKILCADSMEFLQGAPHFDVCFIDPARRGEFNSRKYRFADCTPDIVSHLPLLMIHCDRLLVKASPLLDLTAIREELPGVTRLWVLSRKGECKEILVEVRAEGEFQSVTAAEIDGDGKAETFTVAAQNLGNDGVHYVAAVPIPGLYLYEPAAAVMKLAPWGELCRRWPNISKVGHNSHLFISEERLTGFPGKEYRIDELPDKKRLKTLKGTRLNVLTRNYPLTPAQLKKKLGVTDGDPLTLIATRWGTAQVPTLLLCSRPKSLPNLPI